MSRRARLEDVRLYDADQVLSNEARLAMQRAKADGARFGLLAKKPSSGPIDEAGQVAFGRGRRPPGPDEVPGLTLSERSTEPDGSTPIGMRVTFRATLTERDGRRLLFRVEADDEHERVGEGTHERFVVEMERFMGRIGAEGS